MSERKLASIEKIIDIAPIEGKDRIEYATILGWHVIVGKGDFKVGDLCIYIEYDTILPPKPEFEFLRSRCYSSKYDGFRIRNMKMAGVFSEGIVFSTDLLRGEFGRFNEGRDVSEELGVQKYDLEELEEVKKAKQSKNPIYKWLMRYKWFRKLVMNRKPKMGYPEYIHKSDEKNIQNVFAKHKTSGFLYYTTEKLEGQSATYEVNKKGKFNVYSHNVKLSKQKILKGNWWRTAVRLDIENKMKKFMKEHHIISFALQGEICGPGIQKNIYEFGFLNFFIFNIRDTHFNKDMSLSFITQFCLETGLQMVPLLDNNIIIPDTSDLILKQAEGYSALNRKQIREGIVWRVKNFRDEKTSFKAKSEAYQIWWAKKDKTE